MNTLILEIGHYKIRGMVSAGHGKQKAPIGDYNNLYTILSKCTKLQDGRYVWGQEADCWQMCNHSMTYTLSELEELPDYKDAIADLIATITGRTIPVDAIVFIIPAYWTEAEPKKEILKSAALKNNISSVNYIATPIALCNHKASIEDNGYALVYDAGYLGTSVSLLKRIGNKIEVLDALFCREAGGGAFDSILLNKFCDAFISNLSSPYIQMMYATDLLRRAELAKEMLSLSSECQMPIEGNSRIFHLSNAKWHELIYPALVKSFEICCQMLSDNGIRANMKLNVYTCGGTARIPFIKEELCSFIKNKLNVDINLENWSIDEEIQYLAAKGVFVAQNNVKVNMK